MIDNFLGDTETGDYKTDVWHQATGYRVPDVRGKPGNRLIKIDPSDETQYILLDGEFDIEEYGNTIIIKAHGPSLYDRIMKADR